MLGCPVGPGPGVAGPGLLRKGRGDAGCGHAATAGQPHGARRPGSPGAGRGRGVARGGDGLSTRLAVPTLLSGAAGFRPFGPSGSSSFPPEPQGQQGCAPFLARAGRHVRGRAEPPRAPSPVRPVSTANCTEGAVRRQGSQANKCTGGDLGSWG